MQGENEVLRQQLAEQKILVHPNYQKVRSLVLNKLKLGGQSAAGRAIDAFIKQLEQTALR